MSELQNIQNKYISYIKDNIQNKKGVLLFFNASWCKPCKKLKETLNPLIPSILKNVNIVFVDIDCDKNIQNVYYTFLKKQRIVRGVPSLLLYEQKLEHEYSFHPDFFCETDAVHFKTLIDKINKL